MKFSPPQPATSCLERKRLSWPFDDLARTGDTRQKRRWEFAEMGGFVRSSAELHSNFSPA